MKTIKDNRITTAIACTSIALITTVFAHEVITSNVPTSSKPTLAIKAIEQPATQNKTPKVDPAITNITKEILIPVRHQERRMHAFSRSLPTRSNSYELVELSSNQVEGARYFDVLVTSTNLRNFVIKKGKLTNKANPPKITPKTYLKLKYLTASNKVLIQQNHEWVEKSKHKYLSLIPVTKK